MIGNELDNIEKEVVLNGRLKNFKFKIKAITQSQFSEMQKQCVVLDTKGKKVRFDSTRFSIMTIVKGCIYPNFRADEFVKACGVTLPEQCVVKNYCLVKFLNLQNKLCNCLVLMKILTNKLKK